MRNTAALTVLVVFSSLISIAISGPVSQAEQASGTIDLSTIVDYDLNSDTTAAAPGQRLRVENKVTSQSLFPGGVSGQSLPRGAQVDSHTVYPGMPPDQGFLKELRSQFLFPGVQSGQENLRHVELRSQSLYPTTLPGQGYAPSGALESQSLYPGGGAQAGVPMKELTSLSSWPGWVGLYNAGGGMFLTPSGLLIGNGELQDAKARQARDGRVFVPVELLLTR